MDDRSGLENPVWFALAGNQKHLAIERPTAKRYPRDMAPFVAVDSHADDCGRDALALVDREEDVYFVGAFPALSPDWLLKSESLVLQMVCERPVFATDGRQSVSELGDEHAADMFALTRLAYPRFFRQRTHEMGRYLGIWEGNRLIGMAGERLSIGSYREVSGVCTHPDHQGRGFAKLLISRVIERMIGESTVPFLHVEPDNSRAIALYEQLGFVRSRIIRMIHARREV